MCPLASPGFRDRSPSRLGPALCFLCALSTLRLCVKRFCSSRDYFTAFCAVSYGLPPATRAFVTRPQPGDRLGIVLDIGYRISYYAARAGLPPALGASRISHHESTKHREDGRSRPTKRRPACLDRRLACCLWVLVAMGRSPAGWREKPPRHKGAKMEDSSFRQIWRLSNMFFRARKARR